VLGVPRLEARTLVDQSSLSCPITCDKFINVTEVSGWSYEGSRSQVDLVYNQSDVLDGWMYCVWTSWPYEWLYIYIQSSCCETSRIWLNADVIFPQTTLKLFVTRTISSCWFEESVKPVALRQYYTIHCYSLVRQSVFVCVCHEPEFYGCEKIELAAVEHRLRHHVTRVCSFRNRAGACWCVSPDEPVCGRCLERRPAAGHDVTVLTNVKPLPCAFSRQRRDALKLGILCFVTCWNFGMPM
jgi:hypothetical protein